MAGDGLWAEEQQLLSLSQAAGQLQRALADLDERSAHARAAQQPDGWRVLRLEVPAAAAEAQESLVLGWLEAQAGLLPRALFSSRDGSLLVAGVGSAHVHSLGVEDSQGDAPLLPELSQATHERIRYLGGARFDAADAGRAVVGAEWASFGRSFWALPRVELSVSSANIGLASGTSSETLASSCPSSPSPGSMGGLPSSSCTATLALQLRWRSGVEDCAEGDGWHAERARALSSLRRLRPYCSGMPPAASSGVGARQGEEGRSPEDFHAIVKRALQTFQEGELEKVVLARRVLVELMDRVDAASLLRQVIGSAHKRQYLFLLEPEEGTAFVSLTPERLCKVQGHNVWTEAVAGTWPLADFERAGEAALLASSAKNSSEHQLVVDYICQLLSEVSDHVKVCDTHILKLKHLVHIKQSYHAVAKTEAPSGAGVLSPFGLTDFFCRRMSPTPAVCGLPLESSRRFIQQAESFDRGLYAAPCGVVCSRGSELIVALRSSLVRQGRKLYVYAGAGIVPGSDPAEEFAEISLKMRQFTEAFPPLPASPQSGAERVAALAALPNINTVWATLIVEELVRSGVVGFVICAGSRSTPLVVAVARHPRAKAVVNHDERSGAFFAVGWAKATGKPVCVIVTSGTAVANLLPGAVEAAQSQVPLMLLTADRPAELRDTGANQTIVQPGIFGPSARWAKDFPPPSVEYPAHALLSDMDLAVAHATGSLTQNPGPVHLNFCFRENLAPDSGPVRGAPERGSEFSRAYVETPELLRWVEDGASPRSIYVSPTPTLVGCKVVEDLVELATSGRARIVVLAGTLRSAEDAVLAEDIASRLGAAVFADITSGLRQRPGTAHFADQLLQSPLLAGGLLRPDAVVQLGGPVCSARLSAFVKSARARLHVRVAPAPIRHDADHLVSHHLPCSLSALAAALAEAGLRQANGPPAFWRDLSEVAGKVLDARLAASGGLTEPFLAHAVSRLLIPGGRLQISSSMPIRDLDFFARASPDSDRAPAHPPAANRGASGIDGVISTAAGFCHGARAPSTLIIGDVASLHDLNALNQLARAEPLPLTVIIVNNGGGGIFSFLPISKHTDVLTTFFSEPHQTDFGDACRAFGLPHTLVETAEQFEAAYVTSQRNSLMGACIIEVRVPTSYEENVALHKELGQAVAAAVRERLLTSAGLAWLHAGPPPSPAAAPTRPIVLLHGWLGEKADWVEVAQALVAAGRQVLVVNLPGHGECTMSDRGALDSWEAAALFSQSFAVEALARLLDNLQVEQAVFVGYSLGGRLAMAFAAAHPERVAGVLALSANPGLKSASDRLQRLEGDKSLAARLVGMEGRAKLFDSFLADWYSGPLWGGLQERRPDVYRSMLERRRRTSPALAAHALVGMSVGSQQDLWPSDPDVPLWYACGALDSKFVALGDRFPKKADASPGAVPKVTVLPEAGHALVEERPQRVAELVAELARQLDGGSPPAPKPAAELTRIASARLQPIQLMLKSPLVLSRGDPMPRRTGFLIVLEAHLPGGGTNGDARFVAGVGEVSPLPMFHKESLAEAEAQLKAALARLSTEKPSLTLAVAHLDGSMGDWLAQHCAPPGGELLPSVRSGLEMALMHLVRRTARLPHLGAAAASARQLSSSSNVRINSLVARNEDLEGPSDGASVVKVKVGKDPQEDAQRISSLSETLRKMRGPSARLRLDANQAWTVEEAAAFVNGLSDLAVSVTDYLEEPVRWTDGPESFFEAWGKLAELTGGRLKFAVDESLTERPVSLEHLEACKAPIAALVLKPALQGLEQTARLAAWALQRGAQPVLSSAFESGVALSHFAILAGSSIPALWPEGKRADARASCHGLGTFTRLAEDVLVPPFADLVGCGSMDGSGWWVNVAQCQKALDETADAVSKAR